MKVIIIICYFGKLPNTFETWLESCRMNSDINFLFVSDSNMSMYEIPKNMKLITISFDDLKILFKYKLGFNVIIDSPYKLTDFKPAYAYIFSDEITKYDYWGVCDCDLVFGNIKKYIQRPMEEGYDKIYQLGHLTIYKNNNQNKTLFMKNGGAFSYKEVFTNKEFYSFDEHSGIIRIANEEKLRIYKKEDMADISCRLKRLTVSRNINYKYQVFYYQNGGVYRSYIDERGEVNTEEFIYIHLQKRKINIERYNKNYFILNDRVIEKKANSEPTINEIYQLSSYRNRLLDILEISFYYIKKMFDFVVSSNKNKKIWFKIKESEYLTNKYS